MRNDYTEDDILRIVQDRDIRFINLWFTDILGFLKGFTITAKELEEAFEDGMGFDGSSIKGFSRIDESDMVAKPDPTTFHLLPWKPEENAEAVMIADIFRPDGSPYEGDPRHVLKRSLEKAERLGYDVFNVGPELEFFYFEDDQEPKGLDQGGYFDCIPRDEAQELRRDTVLALEDLDVLVEYAHHEVGPSQHEIDLRYSDALTMADTVMAYRFVVKEIAHMHDVHATFMPKPIEGENGSGMHTHMSLFQNGENAFFDDQDENHLSSDAKHFTAGILEHAREITSITNQWTNSYKRLCPGYEAPVYITWAQRNRSDMIRVPHYSPGKEQATRIEFRSPDPACNPYLAFATMLRAGLAGIENQYTLPDPVEENAYEMSEAERNDRNIDMLPGSLYEGIVETAQSKLVRDTLGSHVFSNFLDNKKLEWEEFRTHVSDYELDKFLPVL